MSNPNDPEWKPEPWSTTPKPVPAPQPAPPEPTAAQPVEEPAAEVEPAPPSAGKPKKTVLIAGVIVLLLVGALIVGLLVSRGGSKEPTALPASTVHAPTKTSKTDGQCSAAGVATTKLVAGGMKPGYELRNSTVIEDGNLVFFGASVYDSAGKAKAQSEVWIIKGDSVYTSTAGAHTYTTFPRASSELKITSKDRRVQAVDKCVANGE